MYFLIIGAGIEQEEMYLFCKKKGYKIISVDKLKKPYCFKYSSYHIVSSVYDDKKTIQKIKKNKFINKIYRKGKLKGVATIGSDSIKTVSRIAKRYKLQSINLLSAKRATNKILMKKLFNKHKVLTPDFKIVKNYDQFKDEIIRFKFPFIMKPSDGRGSMGVKFIDNKKNLRKYFFDSYKQSKEKKILIEEFISGHQYSAEGFFCGKKFYLVGVAYRNYDKLNDTKPYIIEDGGYLPAIKKKLELEKIRSLMENAAFSLGIKEGPFKADLVLNKNNYYIIEIAARLSGNYLSSHHIYWTSGVNLVDVMIDYSLKNKINIKHLTPNYKKFIFVKYFFPKNGKIKKIYKPKDLGKMKYFLNYEIFNKSSKFYQKKITSHKDRAGIIRFMGPRLKNLKDNCIDAHRKFKFIYE